MTIDLGGVARVFTVTLWNRADSNFNTLPQFRIFAGNLSLPSAGTIVSGAAIYNPGCARSSPPAAWLSGSQPSFMVTCQAIARYVTIQRTDGGGNMNLCQVEVTGAPVLSAARTRVSMRFSRTTVLRGVSQTEEAPFTHTHTGILFPPSPGPPPNPPPSPSPPWPPGVGALTASVPCGTPGVDMIRFTVRVPVRVRHTSTSTHKAGGVRTPL